MDHDALGLPHNAASICLVYVHVLEQNKVWVMAVLCVLFEFVFKGLWKSKDPSQKISLNIAAWDGLRLSAMVYAI